MYQGRITMRLVMCSTLREPVIKLIIAISFSLVSLSSSSSQSSRHFWYFPHCLPSFWKKKKLGRGDIDLCPNHCMYSDDDQGVGVLRQDRAARANHSWNILNHPVETVTVAVAWHFSSMICPPLLLFPQTCYYHRLKSSNDAFCNSFSIELDHLEEILETAEKTLLAPWTLTRPSMISLISSKQGW